MPEKPGRAFLFTQQTVGMGFRKTGMVYWAETLAARGWDVSVVTVHLSLITAVTNRRRFAAYPSDAINAWRDRGLNLRGYVWVPPIHPFSLPTRALAPLTAIVARVYSRSLPREILRQAKLADLVVIESTAAVALFDALKQAAPAAKFVYCASDRLVPNGMSPTLEAILQRTAEQYDLVRVPAQSMVGDFPATANVHHIPHGVDRAALLEPRDNPYPAGSVNLVVAGDGAFDPLATKAIAEALPDATVHLFGRMSKLSLGRQPNAIFHGEVPFATLVPYLQHADAGLAPYKDRPQRNYFAESSLRQQQYRLCGLPIVIPSFAAPVPLPYLHLYDANEPKTAGAAAVRALAAGPTDTNPADVLEWNQVVDRVLALVDRD